MTVIAKDLPHVRWGRIDYLAVTAITTQWLIWNSPTLVVLHDRGQTLRFYRPGNIRIDPENLRAFLAQDGWRETEPWSSVWSPRGSRAHILRQFSIYFAKFYTILSKMPRWLILVITGSIASTVLQLLHAKPPAQPKAPVRRVIRPPGSRVAPAAPVAGTASAESSANSKSKATKSATATASATSSPSKAKKRKGGKKT